MLRARRSGLAIPCSFILFFSLLLASSQAQSSAPGGTRAAVPEEGTPFAEPSSPLGEAGDYTVGPQDVLDIDVFGLPELSKTVRVGNEGTIVLALLGRLQAAGLTVDQLRKDLESRYGKTYLQNPQVTVFVREFHSRPVSVMGSVEKPGVYQLTGSQSLIDLLSLAGGFSRSGAAGQLVFVTRKGGFGTTQPHEGLRLLSPDRAEINLDRLFYSRDESLNIPIKAYDIITVNQADKFYVMGGVIHANSFPFPARDQVTVLQAVALAGGLVATASKGNARIIRTKEDGSRTEIPIELGKIIKGRSKDLPLVANDILYINDSTTKAAFRRGMEAVISTASGVTVYRAAR